MYDRHDYTKTLTKRLVYHCGGLEAASQALENVGLPASIATLSNAQNPQKNIYISAAQMRALERFCGNPVMSAAFAAETSGAKQQPPSNTNISAGALLRLQNATRHEMHAVDGEIERSVSDGKVSNTELDRLIAEQEGVVSQAQKHLGWLCAVRTARRREQERQAEAAE